MSELRSKCCGAEIDRMTTKYFVNGYSYGTDNEQVLVPGYFLCPKCEQPTQVEEKEEVT